MVEMVVDLIMAMLTTKYYLHIKMQARTQITQEVDYIKNYMLTCQDDADATI
jgi:hypothetical protein